jgi:hypothetical protein
VCFQQMDFPGSFSDLFLWKRTFHPSDRFMTHTHRRLCRQKLKKISIPRKFNGENKVFHGKHVTFFICPKWRHSGMEDTPVICPISAFSHGFQVQTFTQSMYLPGLAVYRPARAHLNMSHAGAHIPVASTESDTKKLPCHSKPQGTGYEFAASIRPYSEIVCISVQLMELLQYL